MLGYAVKLTLAPQDMLEADVAKLRSVGFSDVDILHVAEVVGYYAYQENCKVDFSEPNVFCLRTTVAFSFFWKDP